MRAPLLNPSTWACITANVGRIFSGDTLAMSVPGTTFYWTKQSTDEDAGLIEL